MKRKSCGSCSPLPPPTSLLLLPPSDEPTMTAARPPSAPAPVAAVWAPCPPQFSPRQGMGRPVSSRTREEGRCTTTSSAPVPLPVALNSTLPINAAARKGPTDAQHNRPSEARGAPGLWCVEWRGKLWPRCAFISRMPMHEGVQRGLDTRRTALEKCVLRQYPCSFPSD